MTDQDPRAHAAVPTVTGVRVSATPSGWLIRPVALAAAVAVAPKEAAE